MPATLSNEEVIAIHEALVAHFAQERDRIDPPGVRSLALLESAVARQQTSFGNVMKYPEPRDNAATLLYGICMDHPFHNGNKRTAFVAALAHLDRNGFMPRHVTHDDFYNMLIALAQHRLVSAASAPRGGKSARVVNGSGLSSDEEVRIVGDWLRRRTRPEDKREHPVTFRQLRRILQRFGVRMANPKDNFADIFRDEVLEESGFLGLGRPRKRYRQAKITQVSYQNDGQLVTVSTIKMIRKLCGLLPENGVDSRAFYDSEATVDYILNTYRNLLKRLART